MAEIMDWMQTGFGPESAEQASEREARVADQEAGNGRSLFSLPITEWALREDASEFGY